MRNGQSDKAIFTHSGTVSRISGCSVFVALESNIHCDSCRAKAACGMGESRTKEIEVQNPREAFEVNEPVRVVIERSLGLKAVFWAYVFPFLLVVATLVAGTFFLPEWQAGLLPIAVLAIYYLILHRARTFFQERFNISVLKLT